MIKTYQQKLLSSILLSCWAGLVVANPIEYQVTNLSGNSWEYAYTVDNQHAVPIEQFTIWFDLGKYENLVITDSPVGWDPLVAQPDPLLPDNGFADWYALISPIAVFDVLSGFSVSFDYLDIGTPGSQLFETFDASFNLIDSGNTRLSSLTPIPEPGSLLLLGIGLVGLFKQKRFRLKK